MAKFLGVDLPKVIKNALGPLVAPLTLVKVVGTAPTAGQLTGGDNPTSTNYRARGFFDAMPTRFPQNKTFNKGKESRRADQIITVLGGYLPSGVEPAVGDSIVMRAKTWRIVAVGVDAAYSTGQSAAYSCLVRGA